MSPEWGDEIHVVLCDQHFFNIDAIAIKHDPTISSSFTRTDISDNQGLRLGVLLCPYLYLEVELFPVAKNLCVFVLARTPPHSAK